MEKEENLKRYTAEDLRAMRERGEDLTDWDKVRATQGNPEEDEEEEGWVTDWTSAQLIIPKAKKHINLRIDDDVVAFFKKTGDGYQTRMNAVLRAYMLAQERSQNQ
jgi:uncharacterized protein (DUF4415 family)